MILIGCYPRTLSENRPTSPIQTTLQVIREVSPENVAVHLLPFYPSSGDHGFAPDSIHDVDPDFGRKEDLQELCAERKCMFDGIYNHVGNKN